MKLKQAREYFELGAISGFDAVRDPTRPGYWMLSITYSKGRNDTTLETALGDTKSFATLDTLVKEVAGITGRVSSLKIAV